jgi:hypothetical protein
MRHRANDFLGGWIDHLENLAGLSRPPLAANE